MSFRNGHALEAVTVPQSIKPAKANPDKAAAPTQFQEVLEAEVINIWAKRVNPSANVALPDVDGTRINSGKKTSSIQPDAFPIIVNNNFQQALSTTPGLLFSEEPSSPIINIGYRGLDTQRSEFIQVLKDGLSIKNEQFGFPETHFTPPLDVIDRIEIIRGGAALQFGPQPGGALNFITRMPRTDEKLHALTLNTYGSDNLFTNFTSVDGTQDSIGYYAYYNRRQRDGFRKSNGDFNLNAGSLKLVNSFGKKNNLVFVMDLYNENHGEPGGLTTISNPGAKLFYDDRNASSRLFDRFKLDRYAVSLAVDYSFDNQTLLSGKTFAAYLSRYSNRQRGGGFGMAPAGPEASTNAIQHREDWIQGAELRLRHDYHLVNSTSTLAGGIYFYHAHQNRRDERGTTPDAQFGVRRNLNSGQTYNAAIFAENRFVFDRLSVVPGCRLENLFQSLDESLNVSKSEANEALASRADFSFIPLLGLGLEYIAVLGATETAQPIVDLYANVSQAYRPRTYGELVPTPPNSVVNGDLKEGTSLQLELGVRGKPIYSLNYDVSGFYYTFHDQVGDITTLGGFSSTGNIGDARFFGIEAAFEFDIFKPIQNAIGFYLGSLTLHANATYVNAKFTSGPFQGNAPSYAPPYQIKSGFQYGWEDWFKAGLSGTIVDSSYADANNSAERFIPRYTTWDLTMEANFFGGIVGIIAGINNLFNENYWSEVRDEGIVPAYMRNYYIGLNLEY